MEENKIVNQKPVGKISLYILGGIALAVYIAWTIFLIWGYFDSKASLAAGDSEFGFALAFAIIVIAYGIIVYAADTILWIIGLIISLVKRKKGLPLRWVITFAIFCVVPAITETIMILAYSAL